MWAAVASRATPLLARAGPALKSGAGWALAGLGALGGASSAYSVYDQIANGSDEDAMKLKARRMQDRYSLEALLDEDTMLRDEQSLSRILGGMGAQPESAIGSITRGIDDYALQSMLQQMAPELQANAERRIRSSSGITYMELLDRMGVT